MRLNWLDVAVGFALGYVVAPWAIRFVQSRRGG